MVGELVFDNLPVPSHDDRVGQVSHHKVRRLYANPTAQMLEIISELILRLVQFQKDADTLKKSQNPQ